MKTLIINGIIIDGSGNKSYPANLAIEDERIIEIGNISPEGFDIIIDAQGLSVAPGFIDTHSHSDLHILKDSFLMPKIMQGITTEIFGQDGTSMSPLPKQYIDTWKLNLAGLNGTMDELDWQVFSTTESYLNTLKKTSISSNVCYFVPHGNIRLSAMGMEKRFSTTSELDTMRTILDHELSTPGVFGFSAGLIYIPNGYCDSYELTELCKVAAKHNMPLVVHQRSEANDILNSMDEIINAGKESGVQVHFSHFKICGKNNADKFERVLSKLDQAKKEGLLVSFDQYPYVAGSTNLSVIIPPWAHAGGTSQLLKRLSDKSEQLKIKDSINDPNPDWDNFIQFANYDGIFITDVKSDKNKDLVGKNLEEVGESRKKDPLTAALDLILEEENAVSMVDFYGLEDHVKAFISRPEMNACTDGLMFNKKPHPRVYGAFPRILGKYSRDEKVVSLESAVYKMTGKPAEVFKIKNRGQLKPNYYADITIFNHNTIIDTATYDNPCQFPLGIEYVLVNGTSVVEKGKANPQIKPGKVLVR